MTQHEKSFNYHKKRFGEIFGQPFAIYTVDYTAQDQTPQLLYTQKKYKVEATGSRLVQSPLPDTPYYCVHGDYDAVNTGYLMLPLRTDSNTPPVTVISKSPFEEITALRTSRKCSIYNGQTLVYSNIYFEFSQTLNYPGKSVHSVLQSSNLPPNNSLIMYKRDLRTLLMDTENLLIKEIDVSPQVVWSVQQVTILGELMQFYVSMSEII